MKISELLPCITNGNESILLVTESLAGIDIPHDAQNIVTKNFEQLHAENISTKFDHGIIVAMPEADLASMLSEIALVRDQLTHHCIVVTCTPSNVSNAEMISLGFNLAGQSPHTTIYNFHIDSYKPTPDWLNDKFWAHPELFDKYRW